MDIQNLNKVQDCCRKLKEMDLTWRQLYCNPDLPVKECKFFKQRKGQLELSAYEGIV